MGMTSQQMPGEREPRDIAYLQDMRRPGMTIYDGRGGSLALDLSSRETLWLADACHRLVTGAIPPGASAIKVRAAEKSYLLSSCVSTLAEAEVRIVNLFEPAERVTLSHDMARMIASLVERILLARPHPTLS
jgi:hypothetical protein